MGNQQAIFVISFLKLLLLAGGSAFLLIITFYRSDFFSRKLQLYYKILEKRRKSTIVALVLIFVVSSIQAVWTIKNGISTNLKSAWPLSEKQKMKEICVSDLMAKQNKSSEQAAQLCDCMIEKITQHYSYAGKDNFGSLEFDKKIRIVNQFNFECEFVGSDNRWSDSIIRRMPRK